MNWYKQASKDISLSAPLKKKKDGFYYLDIPDNFGSSLLSLIDDNSATKPPKQGNGTHISVIRSDELEDDTEIKEVGKDFNFTLKELTSLNPAGWDEMNQVWILEVESKELEELRKKYGLPAKIKGHNFHITVGVEKS